GCHVAQATRLGRAGPRVYGRPISRWLVLIAVAAAAIFAVAGAGAAAGNGRHARVGLVLEEGQVGRCTKPFSCGAFRGLARARRVLHVRAKAVAPSPTGADQFVAPFYWLARQHYNLIIGVGFLELGALAQTARAFPNAKFGLLDAT